MVQFQNLLLVPKPCFSRGEKYVRLLNFFTDSNLLTCIMYPIPAEASQQPITPRTTLHKTRSRYMSQCQQQHIPESPGLLERFLIMFT